MAVKHIPSSNIRHERAAPCTTWICTLIRFFGTCIWYLGAFLGISILCEEGQFILANLVLQYIILHSAREHVLRQNAFLWFIDAVLTDNSDDSNSRLPITPAIGWTEEYHVPELDNENIAAASPEAASTVSCDSDVNYQSDTEDSVEIIQPLYDSSESHKKPQPTDQECKTDSRQKNKQRSRRRKPNTGRRRGVTSWSWDGVVSKRKMIKLVSLFLWPMVLITVMIPSAETSFATCIHVDSPNNENYFAMLTPACDSLVWMKRSRCPFDEQAVNILFDECGFTDLCPPGRRPVCLDTNDGMRFVCSVELSCLAGYQRHALVDKDFPDRVQTRLQRCPPGTYQPAPSSCYDACKFKHRELRTLGDQFVVYSHGDHVNPTLVYCNYILGFFHPEGHFLLNFDDPVFDTQGCSNVKDFDPCEENQVPLPNGTCVYPCTEGYFRDDHDGFYCRMKQGTSALDDSGGALHENTVEFGGPGGFEGKAELEEVVDVPEITNSTDLFMSDRNRTIAFVVVLASLVIALLLLGIAVKTLLFGMEVMSTNDNEASAEIMKF